MATVAGTQFGIPISLSSRSLLRREVADGGTEWLPAVLVFGSIAAVAYADFVVSSVSLGYLYILPVPRSWMSRICQRDPLPAKPAYPERDGGRTRALR